MAAAAASGKSPRCEVDLQKRRNAAIRGEFDGGRAFAARGHSETSMSRILREIMREYRRQLILKRHESKAEPTARARPALMPRLPEARPHVPSPDYRLRVSHL